MGLRFTLFGFCLVSIWANGVAYSANNPSNEWSRIASPTRAFATQSFGFYSGGCISGATALPLETSNLQVMRVARNRYYGHPVLVQTILDLAERLEPLQASLLVSDLGQPRGGPMPFGHASHQNGLDADIWYWEHPEQRRRSLTVQERNQLPMISMLNANGVVDAKKFTQSVLTKVMFAAEDARIQRIFVNPAIKTFLCSKLKPSQRKSLHKLRPWPGHDAHFHIRLYCPAGSTECEPQPEQPAGDGCGEVVPSESNLDVHPQETETEGPPRFLTESLTLTDPLPPICSEVLKSSSFQADGTDLETLLKRDNNNQ